MTVPGLYSLILDYMLRGHLGIRPLGNVDVLATAYEQWHDAGKGT